jgi:hypothetical protein
MCKKFGAGSRTPARRATIKKGPALEWSATTGRRQLSAPRPLVTLDWATAGRLATKGRREGDRGLS